MLQKDSNKTNTNLKRKLCPKKISPIDCLHWDVHITGHIGKAYCQAYRHFYNTTNNNTNNKNKNNTPNHKRRVPTIGTLTPNDNNSNK